MISPPTGDPVGSNLAPRNVKGGACRRRARRRVRCRAVDAELGVSRVVGGGDHLGGSDRPVGADGVEFGPGAPPGDDRCPVREVGDLGAAPASDFVRDGADVLSGEIRRSRISGFPPASFRQETVATPARSTATLVRPDSVSRGQASPGSTAGPSVPSCSTQRPITVDSLDSGNNRQATKARPEGAIAIRGLISPAAGGEVDLRAERTASAIPTWRAPVRLLRASGSRPPGCCPPSRWRCRSLPRSGRWPAPCFRGRIRPAPWRTAPGRQGGRALRAENG